MGGHASSVDEAGPEVMLLEGEVHSRGNAGSRYVDVVSGSVSDLITYETVSL